MSKKTHSKTNTPIVLGSPPASAFAMIKDFERAASAILKSPNWDTKTGMITGPVFDDKKDMS